AHAHRHRRGQGPRRRGARGLGLARGHPGEDQRLRRRDRGSPVDPRRRRAREGHSLRRHDRPRLLHAVARSRLFVCPVHLRGLRLRHELRAQQGPLPGPASRWQQGPHAREADLGGRRLGWRAAHNRADLRARGRGQAGLRGRVAHARLQRL
ncbi:MAG: Acyl dehydratase, partial [uncultured Solirubrobacterales bacterium]